MLNKTVGSNNINSHTCASAVYSLKKIADTSYKYNQNIFFSPNSCNLSCPDSYIEIQFESIKNMFRWFVSADMKCSLLFLHFC